MRIKELILGLSVSLFRKACVQPNFFLLVEYKQFIPHFSVNKLLAK